MRFPSALLLLALSCSTLLSTSCRDNGIEIAVLTATPSNELVVYVTGEVMDPGVYTLPITAERVVDAVEAAGGFTGGADVDSVNLAAELRDGQHVQVLPLGGSTTDIDTTADGNPLIDINSASSELLQSLSLIGPSRAQEIIDYREAHGAFLRIEDIVKVRGIGEKTFEAIREYITVN